VALCVLVVVATKKTVEEIVHLVLERSGYQSADNQDHCPVGGIVLRIARNIDPMDAIPSIGPGFIRRGGEGTGNSVIVDGVDDYLVADLAVPECMDDDPITWFDLQSRANIVFAFVCGVVADEWIRRCTTAGRDT